MAKEMNMRSGLRMLLLLLICKLALAGAPAAEDGRFRVPQILGEPQ